MMYSNLDVSEMFVGRQAQRSSMHARHLNEQLVRVLKTICYDVGFQKGQGQYLFDRDGARYLDLLSGFGVFAIGRNHPALRQALKSVLDSDFPNLVQLDVSTLAGVLAERLLEHVPYLDKVFFANSGAETVEAAIKFARGATGRTGKFLAVEHWNVEPDMVLLAKALSGGHVPVGALLTRKSIFDKIFNQMDRAVVHGSTFAKNDLAMAAGIATLDVIKQEKLVEQAAKRGAELRLALTRMVPGYELLKEVRGKGLMIGIEFGR